MRVKIGGQVFDSAEVPIMLILGPEDKSNIASMPPSATRYARFPEISGMSAKQKQDWMEKIPENLKG